MREKGLVATIGTEKETIKKKKAISYHKSATKAHMPVVLQ